jgi:hypothetical protein
MRLRPRKMTVRPGSGEDQSLLLEEPSIINWIIKDIFSADAGTAI